MKIFNKELMKYFQSDNDGQDTVGVLTRTCSELIDGYEEDLQKLIVHIYYNYNKDLSKNDKVILISKMLMKFSDEDVKNTFVKMLDSNLIENEVSYRFLVSLASSMLNIDLSQIDKSSHDIVDKIDETKLIEKKISLLTDISKTKFVDNKQKIKFMSNILEGIKGDSLNTFKNGIIKAIEVDDNDNDLVLATLILNKIDILGVIDNDNDVLQNDSSSLIKRYKAINSKIEEIYPPIKAHSFNAVSNTVEDTYKINNMPDEVIKCIFDFLGFVEKEKVGIKVVDSQKLKIISDKELVV